MRVKNIFGITSPPDTPFINSAISSIIGIVVTAIITIIINRKWFINLSIWVFHKTPYDNIWMDVLDFTNGSNLKVYLKDEPFYIIGHYLLHEDNKKDSWFVITAFTKIDRNTNQIYNNEPSYSDNPEIKYVFRLSDVEHMEIF